MSTDILFACAGLAVFALGFLLGRVSHPHCGRRHGACVIVYDDSTVEVIGAAAGTKDDRTEALDMASEAIHRRRWGGSHR